MAYCRKWVPPTIPLRDDIEAWKLLFNDLHENMLLAGLAQTDTPGQIDFDEVAELPADGDYAGFIEYAFTDGLQIDAPVILRLDFGCGREGLYAHNGHARSRTPRVKAKVSFKGIWSSEFFLPQGYGVSAGGTSQLTSAGVSYICLDYNRGFFGICYGAGSRNKPYASNSYGKYTGSSFTVFLQRAVDDNHNPSGAGLAIYMPDLTSAMSSGLLPVSKVEYLTGLNPNISSDNYAHMVGGLDYPTVSGNVLFQDVFMPGNKPKPWVTLKTYVSSAIPEGSEILIDGVNYITIGNETGFSVDHIVGEGAGLAMLFEGD